MKRLSGTLFFALFLVFPLLSQEASQPQNSASPEQKEEAAGDRLAGWRWANFAILAAGLGYLIVKKSPAFFNARSEEIQKAIKDATGLKVEAEFRSSEIDRRMATLSGEIQKLRESAKAELERESERIDSETRATLTRMQEHATREIEALRHQASLAVREHAIRLATELAIVHLRENPQEMDNDELVHAFAADVMKGAR